MMAGVRDTNGELLELWERAETEHGVPYYINHVDESTQWDHPVVERLINDLDNYGMIKYAAYRTAMKIVKIQRTLNLECVTLSSVISCFQKSALFACKGNGRKFVSCRQLQDFVTGVFIEAQMENSVMVRDLELYSELVTNILLDICDLCRKGGKVPILYMKVYLVILCSGRLPDKYKYIFNLVADARRQFDELGLTKLFHILADIPEFLFEGSAFGSKLVPGAVKSCLAGLTSDSSLSEDMFLEWLLREPQNVVWVSTLTRLKAAERVQHDIKCKVCKKFPIFGFRYNCLKCLNYNQCQQCFFLGFHNKQHKVKHPVQEYCRVARPAEETKAFLMRLRNNLKLWPLGIYKKRYLPVDISNSSIKIGDSVIENRFYDRECNDITAEKVSKILQTDDFLWEGSRILVQPTTADGSDVELESIIVHLEDENRLFLKEVEEINRRSTSGSCSSLSSGENEDEHCKALMQAQNSIIHEHNQQIQVQIHRLRQLLQQFKTPDNKVDIEAKKEQQMQSTPTADEPHASFKNISPIETLQVSLNSLAKAANGSIQTRTPLSSDNYMRQSLRRKVLKPKNFNATTIPRSVKTTGINKSRSLYGIEDLTVSVGSRTLNRFCGSLAFTLPHGTKDSFASMGSTKNELQEIITKLENITPL